MSANMAACIAVESISILEKLHSKGTFEGAEVVPWYTACSRFIFKGGWKAQRKEKLISERCQGMSWNSF